MLGNTTIKRHQNNHAKTFNDKILTKLSNRATQRFNVNKVIIMEYLMGKHQQGNHSTVNTNKIIKLG